MVVVLGVVGLEEAQKLLNALSTFFRSARLGRRSIGKSGLLGIKLGELFGEVGRKHGWLGSGRRREISDVSDVGILGLRIASAKLAREAYKTIVSLQWNEEGECREDTWLGKLIVGIHT